MDVEAEILGLKLRMEALEEAVHSGGCIAAMLIGVYEAQVSIAGVQNGMADDLAAIAVEVAGLRWQGDEHFRGAQAQIHAGFEALRTDMLHLAAMIDQLLKKDSS
ncbi:hypothetical protein [Nonomuraea sp. NPDC002799]